MSIPAKSVSHVVYWSFCGVFVGALSASADWQKQGLETTGLCAKGKASSLILSTEVSRNSIFQCLLLFIVR
jgi:hypothetical protein